MSHAVPLRTDPIPDLEALLDASLALQRANTPRDLLPAVVPMIGDDVAVALLTRQHGALRLFCGERVPEGAELADIGLTSALGERLATGVPVSTGDVRAVALRELGATMAYPLVADEVLLAVLAVGRVPFARSATVHAGLVRFAPHLAAALARSVTTARTRALAEKEGRERAGRVLELTRSFGVTTSLTTLLGEVLRRAVEAAGAEKGSLSLLDEATDELVVRVVAGLPDKAVQDRINRGELACVRLKRGQGVAGRVLATGEAVVVADARKDARFAEAGRSGHVGTLACLPLRHGDEVIGVLNLTTARPRAAVQADLDGVLGELAQRAAIAIRRTRVYEAVTTDPTTGLYVGQMVASLLEGEVRRAQRYGRPLAVVTVRIGVQGAWQDELLRDVGAVFRRVLRSLVDLAAHEGDGRFVVVLPETDVDGARVAARRLAAELGTLGPGAPVEAVGVVGLEATDTVATLLRRGWSLA